MTLTLRRILAALLALWSLFVLLPDSGLGWTLLVLVGAALLWRRPTPPGPLAAPHAPAPPVARPVARAVTPVEPVPYWLLPAAAAGAAAVLHDREQPSAGDAEQEAEEDLCEESDSAEYTAPVAADWEHDDDATADDFGGFGGGGSWGGASDFGGSGGGGDWGDGGGDDFGGFGGGGDWGGGDDW